MTKQHVLVTRPDVPTAALDMLKKTCELTIYDQERPIPRENLLEMIKDKEGLLCMLTDPIDEEVIEAAGSKLKVIATMSVGYEHIDIVTAKKKNIQVSHTPDVSTDSVAEWTVALMLAAGRKMMEAGTTIKDGKWEYSWGPVWLCGDGLKGSVVGIVGMGRIGQGIMQRVLPFGVKKVLYYDVFHPIKPAEDMGAVYTNFDDLIKQSDYIVSMCNLTEETKNLFCKKVFDHMKPNAVFVNTSRGGVVNQVDLYDALKKNTFRAAALDVTLPEPLPSDHQLLTLPNLLVTPHVASAELHVRAEMAKLAAENILLALHGKKVKTSVKMP